MLTEPIELGAVPADGEEVTAAATGDLTLHGVTRAGHHRSGRPARRQPPSPSTARTTVTFSDYDIDDPSGGPASVGDEGELEVLLVFSR